MLALVESLVAAIEGLLALHHAVLEGANLVLTLFLLGLGGLLILDVSPLLASSRASFEGLGLTLCITDQGLSSACADWIFRRPREDYPAWLRM